MHLLVYHVPKFLKEKNAMKRFTGQGIEKINDLMRSFYHNKSNRHDACTEALLAIKRIDRLQEYERQPHEYKKKKAEYWTKDIFEQRKKRPRLSVEPRDEENIPDNNLEIDSLSLEEIKEKLLELGVKTRARKLDKLREILRQEIN